MEKAYELNMDKIIEGYRYSPVIVYADTRGKAKSIMWEDIKYDNYGLLYSDDPLSFLNLPIRRSPQNDKILFEGQWMPKYQVKVLEDRKKREKKLRSFLTDGSEYCYIRKGSYYCDNWCGYTDFKIKAGVYKIKEAVEHAIGVDNIWLEIIDVAAHNTMIDNEIAKLTNRKLKWPKE